MKGVGDPGVDLWRETPVRFLGYANEVGEAFRPQFPRVVIPSYAVAFMYCLGDTAAKTQLAYQQEESFNSVCVQTSAETFVWQTLASVLIPGFTINRVVAAAQWGLTKAPKAHPLLGLYGATTVGLLSIPLIITPIDRFVDHAMLKARKYIYPSSRG